MTLYAGNAQAMTREAYYRARAADPVVEPVLLNVERQALHILRLLNDAGETPNGSELAVASHTKNRLLIQPLVDRGMVTHAARRRGLTITPAGRAALETP